jgi:hypothetical protein
VSHIDPTLLTALVSAGVLASLSQLILAVAAFIRQKTNALSLGAKVDENTSLTKEIHTVTNGPLTNREATIGSIETKIDTHAATAAATAEAAKVQAATDAQASKDK